MLILPIILAIVLRASLPARAQPLIVEQSDNHVKSRLHLAHEEDGVRTGCKAREKPEKIKFKPWSQLPPASNLEITDGTSIEAGGILLMFDRGASVDRMDDCSLLRLRSATCPPLRKLVYPAEGRAKSYNASETNPEHVMAEVFPIVNLDNQQASDGDSKLELAPARGGMYEFRVNGSSDEALREAIELLYTLLPPPAWARNTAELPTTMTANEYLTRAMCLHIRGGYENLLASFPPALPYSIARPEWMQYFSVRDIGDPPNELDHLMLEVTESPQQSGGESTRMDASADSSVLAAIGERPSPASITVEKEKWTPYWVVTASEGDLHFEIDSYGLLVLADATCPRWGRPTPRKPTTRLGLSAFPAVFDDGTTFLRRSSDPPGVAILMKETRNIRLALARLLEVVKMPTEVEYTYEASAGNTFLLNAICSHVIADPYTGVGPKLLNVDRTTVYSQDSRFWIQFDVDADSEEFLVLRAAVCPLRRELVYGVSKLV
ncbi:hypothetical protein Pmar_PMAR006054 [Perkinsus marinus ATCC 50983]|uniref:Uncharacterized protein n=1 Tax=Perkinsus marinus (strain ATCC 50983 / TXsc) TaxID=423536 RepID=C5LA33_PERM5|nr:hypothetical protein Pmar_PMAR006054 [Perkinsus marinus ATCC 50983]EER06289.1 hypothetical protein Pmar_PMAR006054 [Perkinsus marinus ATCC 50983]|eukprot:XP_002774473.1 hypothetical protein Pmar_PMAR006054 [Perkinsus marinus ATCC 50983]